MPSRDRIIAALCADDGELRRAGLTLIIDQVLDQTLDAWLDADALTGMLVDALSADNAERVIAQHVLPGLGRVRAALAAADETLGDSLSDAARVRLENLVTQPNGPRFAWLAGALDRDKMGKLLAPALQEVFMSFASRISLGTREAAAGGSSAASVAAGLMGRLGRGTGERLLNLGKSVADGLGVDLEARLRDAAYDYSQGAVASLQRAISARLKTPEAATLVEGLQRSVLAHVLETPLSVILDDLDRLPLSEAIGLAAPILEHDLSRTLWRGIVASEVKAVLNIEGKRTLRAVLEEAGLLTSLREQVLQRADPVARELFGSQPFADWLARVLDA